MPKRDSIEHKKVTVATIQEAFKLFVKFNSYVVKYWKAELLLILCGIISTLLSLFTPYLGKLILDNGILQSQVEVAKAAVAEAEAARNKLVAGATPTELAQAQADIVAAQGAVAQAQATLKQMQEAATASETQIAIAQAQYNELASRPSPAEQIGRASCRERVYVTV